MEQFKIAELLIYIIKQKSERDFIKEEVLTKLSDYEWEQLFTFAADQGVLAFTFDVLKKRVDAEIHSKEYLSIPKSLWIKWILSVENIEKRYTHQQSAIKELAQYFRRHGVDMILLKGHDLSRNYDNPAHRECGDIDIYLPGSFDYGNKLIENLGIEVNKEGLKHSNFIFKGIPVENHKTFLNVIGSEADTKIENRLREILSEKPCEYILIDNVKITVPPPDFTALFLTRHNIYHFFNSGAVLKYFFDFSVFFNKFYKKIDLPKFFEIIETTKMTRIFTAFMIKSGEFLSIPNDLFCNSSFDKIIVASLADRIERDILTNYYHKFDKSQKENFSFIKRKLTGAFRFFKSKWRYDSIDNVHFYKSFFLRIAIALSFGFNFFSICRVVLKHKKILILTVITSLLELAGVIIFVPLLILLSNTGNIASGSIYAKLFSAFNLQNHQTIIASSILVLLLIIFKNFIIHKISRYKTKKLLEEYKILSKSLFQKYFNNGLIYTKNQGAAHLSHNVNFVCNTFVFGYLGPLISLFGEYILICLILILIAIINIHLAVAETLLFVPLFLFYYKITRRVLKNAGKNDHSAKRSLYKTTLETFRGYTEILINNAFDKQYTEFERGIESVSESKLKIDDIRSNIGKTLEVIISFIIVALIVFYNFVGFKGFAYSIELFIGLFIISSYKLLYSVRGIMGFDSTVKSSAFSSEILDSESILNYSDTAIMGRVSNRTLEFKSLIECKQISFGYNINRLIFKDFSLTINKGEKIGIKGISGKGKSTLLNLIMGLINPISGEILIDGIDLCSTDKAGWFPKIGYVSQETFILNDSLKNNIVIALKEQFDKSGIEISEILLKDALLKSQLNDLVENLPEGIETRLGENGASLSGGERQRISIARAFLKNPQILILDEPTSNLDRETEEKIVDSISQMINNGSEITLIIVSHNERLFSLCNRIIDFNDYPGIVT